MTQVQAQTILIFLKTMMETRQKAEDLEDQCKEIEENNKIGKTRDLFKKIRDTKGTFQAKMGTIKDRNVGT